MVRKWKRPLASFCCIGNCAKNRATSTELLKIEKWFGSGSGYWPLFCCIGNCAKNRTTSTELLKIEKWFGSGSGHWPLFCCIGNCAKNRATSTELQKIAKRLWSGAAARMLAGNQMECGRSFTAMQKLSYKLKVIANIHKSVFALYWDLYYDLVVQNTLKNKDLFMHLNDIFIKAGL